MDDMKPIVNTGLRGLTIATTRVSDVDGENGILKYRGYLIKDLAGKTTFEEIIYLLLFEELPSQENLEAFCKQLEQDRHLPPDLIQAMETRPKDSLPMDILISAVAMLANHDPDTGDNSKEAALRMGCKLIAKLPVLITSWNSIREGRKPLEPMPDLNTAANFLYMLTGKIPDDELAEFLDTALVLHAEHSFNASTFSARQVASTMAHMYAAAAAAVGSLSGALHGGANTRVMQMLLEIGSVDKIDEYINSMLETGGKIMGLGHAVYQTDDPRARILSPMSKTMGERTGDTRWFELSDLLEKKGKKAFKKKKGSDIYVNVDFYSASLYYYMGIPIDLFTPVFAASRIAGWVAHVIEEQFAGAAGKPVLYRPESEYVGDYCGPEECSFIPLNDRKT